MHAAGFIYKTLPDIFRVSYNMPQGLEKCSLLRRVQACLIFRYGFDNGVFRLILVTGSGRRWRRLMATQIEAWGTWHLVHSLVRTEGALDLAARELVLKIILGCEPAFKRMLVGALEIENFHVAIICK